ncbi:hypothetical protein I4U23_020326 [Adineta vaga]|nr:hypothetical protein I4U23_020326 [Adineta vaga]
MTQQVDKRISVDRLHQTVGNVFITFPDHPARRTDPTQRFNRVSVQHITTQSKAPSRFFDAYLHIEKERAARTGQWILNVIAAQESYRQAKLANKNNWYTDTKETSFTKKHSFQSRKSSKVEPFENFLHTQNHQNKFLQQPKFTPTTIHNAQTTALSCFSSATSVDDIQTIECSSRLSETKSGDYSTDEFEEDEERRCISNRMLIIFSVIAAILIIGIIIAVFVTIFVVRRE